MSVTLLFLVCSYILVLAVALCSRLNTKFTVRHSTINFTMKFKDLEGTQILTMALGGIV